MSQRKSCVFCGCDDCKISREHAWPNWSRKLIAPPGKSTISGFRHKNQPERRFSFVTVDDMGLQVNDVCKERCNEGWMHSLEEAVRPILSPLIEFGSGHAFDVMQQALVARWMLKTAMVFEFTGTEAPFYTFDERKAVRERKIPASLAYMMMWTAWYRGPHMSLSFGTRIGFDMQVGDDVIPMDAHSASISLGQFMFQTLTVRVPQNFGGILQFPMLERWGTRTVPIFPLSKQPSLWPPTDFIKDEAEFNDFIRRFERSPELLR